MSNTAAAMDMVKTILLVVLVVFVSFILADTIFVVILATAFFYAFWHYYNKSKLLKRQLSESGIVESETPAPTAAPQDTNPSPTSTDA